MPELMWAMVCGDGIVDARTNNVTLINIIEQVVVPSEVKNLGLPLLVLLWRRTEESDEEFKYRLQWVDAADNILDETTPDTLTIGASHERLRTFTRLGRLPIKEPGRYSLVVQCSTDADEWELAGSYDIEIKRQAEA